GCSGRGRDGGPAAGPRGTAAEGLRPPHRAMSPRRALCRDVGAALFRDEVGIEYGIYGDYRLKSAYQPIFAPRGGDLAPVAVEALLQPQLLGQPVPRDI